MKNKFLLDEIFSELIEVKRQFEQKLETGLKDFQDECGFVQNYNDYSEEYEIKTQNWLKLRHKWLTKEPQNSWLALRGLGFSRYEEQGKDAYDYFSKLEKKIQLPDDFKELLTKIGIEDGQYWASLKAGRYLGLGSVGEGLKYHPRYRKEIKLLFKEMSDLFPPLILNRTAFFCTINSEQFLFTWLLNKGDEAETSEILILDIVDRTISRLSNNMANFLLRGVECIKLEEKQDIYEPSEEVLQIIRQIDGDNVLPSKSAIYELDDLESFPDSWKKMLTKKDYEFEV